MDLDPATVLSDLKAHFESGEADARKWAGEYLPWLSNLLEKTSTNELAVAAMNVVHVPPETLSAMASVLMKFDADLGQQQEATAAAQSALAAAQAPAEPAAEPEPEPAT